MREQLSKEDYNKLPVGQRVEDQRKLARGLGAYTGKWVVVKNATIVGSGETLAEAKGMDLDGSIIEVGDGTKMILTSH
ncbi:hypothetical protein KW803_00345 [Candidatus Saccharibacteria bacterium]|nr:hypothetical protein [Candidatus Saccharibacteria bacterium]